MTVPGGDVDGRVRRRPELDGVRAVAVLAVLASHTGVPWAQGGWMGVDVFFVLSGYLITALLLAEHHALGRIDLGRFYARRALRLYPALLLVLLLGSAFHHTLGPGGTLTGYLRSALGAALYVQDFVIVYAPATAGDLGHTWSLAVEEQFYLVWPVVLLLLLRYRRRPVVWALVAAALGWLSMTLALHPSGTGVPEASYYLPWNRFPQLLVGAAVAALVARRPVPRAVSRGAVGWSAAAAAAILVLAAARLDRYPHLVWEAPAIAAAAGALVWHLAADRPSSLGRVLRAAPLVWLGRRSYGVYLFHVPVLVLLQTHLNASRSTVAAAMLLITVLLAAVSYRVVELPFLRLKARLHPTRDRGHDRAGPSAPAGDAGGHAEQRQHDATDRPLTRG